MTKFILLFGVCCLLWVAGMLQWSTLNPIAGYIVGALGVCSILIGPMVEEIL